MLLFCEQYDRHQCHRARLCKRSVDMRTPVISSSPIQVRHRAHRKQLVGRVVTGATDAIDAAMNALPGADLRVAGWADTASLCRVMDALEELLSLRSVCRRQRPARCWPMFNARTLLQGAIQYKHYRICSFWQHLYAECCQ